MGCVCELMQLDTSVKDLAESERFETKLRELFGFANPARRRPGRVCNRASDLNRDRGVHWHPPPGRNITDDVTARSRTAVTYRGPPGP